MWYTESTLPFRRSFCLTVPFTCGSCYYPQDRQVHRRMVQGKETMLSPNWPFDRLLTINLALMMDDFMPLGIGISSSSQSPGWHAN